MQANPNDEMDRRYQNLTEKQRAVIDAHAQNPDETNREKAHIAGVEILGQESPVNESYCSEILNKKFSDLAKYREEIKQNERPVGEVETSGDPFTNLSSDTDQSVQSIQDRPVKESGVPGDAEGEFDATTSVRTNRPIQVADVGDGVVIKLNYRYVQQLLESQDAMLPNDLHEQLVDVVVQRAFK